VSNRRIGRSSLLALVMTLVFASSVLAFGKLVHISGTVAKSGSWANYTTTRCTTVSSTSSSKVPHLAITAWPGSNATMYAYVRNPDTNAPMGYGTPSNPVAFPLHDLDARNLGGFQSGTCFRISARKDGFPFAIGSEWWNGDLWY
jgi:hypothetical protein